MLCANDMSYTFLMSADELSRDIERLLIVMPTWVGDVVMATPTLRALRGLFTRAQITVLSNRNVRPLLDGCPWVDRVVTVRQGSKRPDQPGKSTVGRGMLPLARRLGAAHFDVAVLLPNSFRAALLVRLAGIDRRVGYDRDGRGGLLTDLLVPRRDHDGYVPVSTRDYYLGIARFLGATRVETTMQLFTRREDDQAADDLLARCGHEVHSGRRLVVINPGAKFGQAKLWPAPRFARLADLLIQRHDVDVALTGAPDERVILDEVQAAARHELCDLPAGGLNLKRLKSVMRRCDLLVTNDTGTRHIGAAIGTPVVTIFGPTNPAWTTIDYDAERQVRVDVYCSPCQKKTCPLRGTPEDHQCMTLIDPEMVLQRCEQLLKSHRTCSSPLSEVMPSRGLS